MTMVERMRQLQQNRNESDNFRQSQGFEKTLFTIKSKKEHESQYLEVPKSLKGGFMESLSTQSNDKRDLMGVLVQVEQARRSLPMENVSSFDNSYLASKIEANVKITAGTQSFQNSYEN